MYDGSLEHGCNSCNPYISSNSFLLKTFSHKQIEILFENTKWAGLIINIDCHVTHVAHINKNAEVYCVWVFEKQTDTCEI